MTIERVMSAAPHMCRNMNAAQFSEQRLHGQRHGVCPRRWWGNTWKERERVRGQGNVHRPLGEVKVHAVSRHQPLLRGHTDCCNNHAIESNIWRGNVRSSPPHHNPEGIGIGKLIQGLAAAVGWCPRALERKGGGGEKDGGWTREREIKRGRFI